MERTYAVVIGFLADDLRREVERSASASGQVERV